MLHFIDYIIRRRLSLRDALSNSNLYLQLSLRNACLYILLTHIFLLVFFACIQIWSMALISAAGACCSLLCQLLINRKRFALAGTILTLELLAYTLAACLVTGHGNYLLLYIFFDLTVQLLVPYRSVNFRELISSFFLPYLIFLLFLDRWFPPRVEIGPAHIYLELLMVLITFMGICSGCLFMLRMKAAVNYHIRRQIALLQQEAYLDPLTHLHNRRYADIVFNKLAEYDAGARWHAALLDIDSFKTINDNYGHLAGDLVLQTLSEIVQDILSAGDFAFRWGGEEFLLLIKDSTPGQTARVLEHIRAALEQADVLFEHKAIHFTATIGASPFDVNQPLPSVNLCDRKLYQGKRNGKNQVVL